MRIDPAYWVQASLGHTGMHAQLWAQESLLLTLSFTEESETTTKTEDARETSDQIQNTNDKRIELQDLKEKQFSLVLITSRAKKILHKLMTIHSFEQTSKASKPFTNIVTVTVRARYN